MKARLTTGEIIELTKDCDCLTHEGHCFLYYDGFQKEQNREMLKQVQARVETAKTMNEVMWLYSLARRWVQLEAIRLREKISWMERNKIEEILA